VWHTGIVNYGGNAYYYQVKSADTGSEHGIDGGRIFYLLIQTRISGKMLAEYDQRWLQEPETKAAKYVYSYLLQQFN
jgi:hypothetical protein